MAPATQRNQQPVSQACCPRHVTVLASAAYCPSAPLRRPGIHNSSHTSTPCPCLAPPACPAAGACHPTTSRRAPAATLAPTRGAAAAKVSAPHPCSSHCPPCKQLCCPTSFSLHQWDPPSWHHQGSCPLRHRPLQVTEFGVASAAWRAFVVVLKKKTLNNHLHRRWGGCHAGSRPGAASCGIHVSAAQRCRA